MKRIIAASDGTFKISKPGFDVDTADDDDLLLHANASPAIVIAAGRLFVPVSTPQQIMFGLSLSQLPVVDFQTSDGIDYVLCRFFRIGDGYATVTCEVSLTGIRFTAIDTDRYVNYIAFARSV